MSERIKQFLRQQYLHFFPDGQMERRSTLDPQYRFGHVNRWGTQLVNLALWSRSVWVLVGLALSLTLAAFTFFVPFSVEDQLIFSACLLLPTLYLRRYVGTFITLLLISFSIIVSTRYLAWRFTATLGNEFSSIDFLFGIGLLLAEIYSWIVLIFGFFQTAWPLNRKPVPLPADTEQWPTVDVFIPTYNEPLSVVRPTVIAAMQIDWPKEKIKIYILDDGRRDEFKEFAHSVGVDYIVRGNNSHAKAGNLNNALRQTTGELVAIFDCDHIATRSFLQLSAGWFLVDSKLAMLQTPHHFLSPDPFERNLGLFQKMPNEGELFYGLVQNGNDLWNATFFCGSCALIRRSMLMEVGGIAQETVTEDAHTALKLNRLGYNTAYIGIIQAAGLATESLGAHVRQRIRWARGMAQIFRVDNPIFARGLSFAQRICYLNAMSHFFYGLPRIVFLTAPLAYLFFEAHVIQASADLIFAYALPHLAHATIVNSRIQGRNRHSFWGEVYETALAWYIMIPTTLALINPKMGKFDVTAKGGRLVEDYFDWRISSPYLVLFFLNLLGLGVGVGRMLWWNTFEVGTVVLNLLWTIYNLILLGAAMGVALETKQVRSNWRVRMQLPGMVSLPDGHTITCVTEDFSEGGFALALPVSMSVLPDTQVAVSVFRGGREFSFPAAVVSCQDTTLRVKFDQLSDKNYSEFVAATFSRADAWQTTREKTEKTDKPLQGLGEIFRFSLVGVHRMMSSLWLLIPKNNFSFSLSRK